MRKPFSYRHGALLGLSASCLAVMSPAAPVQAGTAPGTASVRDQRERLPGPLPGGGADLPNGWRITPAGQAMATLGDLVTNAALSPDGKTLATVNSGFLPHGIDLFDVTSGKHLQHVGLPSAWLGLVWAPDGRRLFVSGGNASGDRNDPTDAKDREGLVLNQSRDLVADSRIPADPVAAVYGFTFADGRLDADHPVRFTETIDPKKVWWSGVAYLPARHLVYAADRGTGGQEDKGAVVVFDAGSRALVTRIPVGVSPYQLLLSPDGARLYVSNWSSRSVSVIDTAGGRVIGEIPVGANPNDMKLSADGRLFVACSADNSVHVIDTRDLKPIETISTALTLHAPEGSTPDALALDDARHLLYVADADNDSVMVADIADRRHSAVAGFIPTGWYPSALALADKGKTLFIGTAKGESGHPDPLGPMSTLTEADVRPYSQDNGSAGPSAPSGIYHIGKGSVHTLQTSTLERLDVSDLKVRLPQWTRAVVEDTPYKDSLLSEAPAPHEPSVIPRRVGAGSPIKHIIYIIKENRTYDQEFGDIKGANGDPRLTLFGEKVTPNQHALAREYVTLDNLYCDGEVSNDGHRWLAGAYATDFYEKQWPSLYGGISKGDYEVQASVPIGGWIWDLAKRKGLTYRTYAEGTKDIKVDKQSVQVPRLGMEVLAGHIAPNFPNGLAIRDTEKLKSWLAEFHEYERNYDSKDPARRLPNFQTVWLMEDHTTGARPGNFTPTAMVADNDYAIGQLVEAVSHSRYWPETAIFIMEDDAQDGSDHVDARRTVGLVISPYVKRGVVDSTLYSTSSMLRSMELLLGLPTMSQYDAAAMPMYAAFGATAKPVPFTAIPPQVDTTARNVKTAWGAKASMKMDLSEPDHAPMHALNEIVWKSVMGAGSTMPAPVHRFRPLIDASGDGDDDDDGDHRKKG